MSTGNMTYDNNIVTVVTPANAMLFGRNVAGTEGYEIILLEKVGSGRQYVRTLYPGQDLRFAERIFGNYEPLAVDMRRGQKLDVAHTITTQDRTTKLSIKAVVNYAVQDSYTVACEVRDPVRVLQDRIQGSLADFMQSRDYNRITEALAKQVIRGVQTDDLGLVIHSVDTVDIDYTGRPQRDVLRDDKFYDADTQMLLDHKQAEREIMNTRAKVIVEQIIQAQLMHNQDAQQMLANRNALNASQRDMLLPLISTDVNERVRSGEITVKEAAEIIREAHDSLREQQGNADHIVFGTIESNSQSDPDHSDPDDDLLKFGSGVDDTKDI